MADKYINPTGLQTIKTWIEGRFALGSDLSALQQTVEGIVAEGGEPNTIDTISVNGTNVPPDANKNVALTIPTQTSQLTNNGDGTSNFATESYVNTYGGKIDIIKVNGSTQTITNKTVDITVPTTTSELTNNSDYVADASYVHTDNNFTTTLKNKLDGIAAGAEVNVNPDWNASSGDAQILNKPTTVSAFTNDAGYQTAAQVETTINTKMASVYRYKGSVATYADLPSSGNTAGDVYDVQSSGVNYAWTGTAWDALGAYVDTSLYWAKSELVAMTTSEINTILNA